MDENIRRSSSFEAAEMSERMSDEGFEKLTAAHAMDRLSQCNFGWLIDERAKVRELEAEVVRWKKFVGDAHLLFEDMQDRAEAAKAKVARVQWTVKKWKALDGLSITVGEVLTDCANEITEALQEPEHD